jgi:hypothetical protein
VKITKTGAQNCTSLDISAPNGVEILKNGAEIVTPYIYKYKSDAIA